MKNWKVRLQVFGFLMSMLLVVFLGTTSIAAGSTLETVDLQAGICYVYSTTDSANIIGLDLNGNSVVITESNNSTPENPMFSIYLDKDKSGTISEGDHPLSVTVNSETVSDFPSAYKIYGLYNKKSVTPISIAMVSGSVHSIYGIYKSELSTSADTALKVNITGGTVQYLYGSYGSEMNAGASTNCALDLDVTDNGMVSQEFIGVDGKEYYNLPDKYSKIIGKIDVNYNPITDNETTPNNSCAYGVKEKVDIIGDVKVLYNNLNVVNKYGLNNRIAVEGDYIFDVQDGCALRGQVMGARTSLVTGDATVSVKGYSELESNYQTMSVWGFWGVYPGKEYLVEGKYTFNYNGNYTCTCNPIWEDDANHSKIGDVEINLNAGRIKSLTGMKYVDVDGNANILTKNTCAVEGTAHVVLNSNVNGNVTINMSNANTTKMDSEFYGVYQSNVTGDVSVVVNGGIYQRVSAVCGNNPQVTTIGGNINVELCDINKDTTNMGYSYGYGVQYLTAKKDIRVVVDELEFNVIYGVYQVDCMGNVSVEMKNTTATNNLYGVAGPASVKGDITCDISNSESEWLYAVALTDTGSCEGTTNVTATEVTVSHSFKLVDEGVYKGPVILKANNCTAKKYAYVAANATYEDKLKVNVNGGSYGTDYDSGFAAVSEGVTKEGAEITICDTEIDAGWLYLYKSDTSEESFGDIVVDVDNTSFNATNQNGKDYSLTYTTDENQTIRVDFDEDCEIADNLQIKPDSDSAGGGVCNLPNEKYCSGNYEFTEDVTMENMHFVNAQVYIPKNVTVTVTDMLWLEQGETCFLIEGTLIAESTQKQNGGSGSIYLNGGSIGDTADLYDATYYAIVFDYEEKGGSVTSNITKKHEYGKNCVFANEGDSVEVTVTPKDQFDLEKVTVFLDGNEEMDDVTVDDTVYRFAMPDAQVVFNADFVGENRECAFAATWSSDDQYHWYDCTHMGCNEIKDKAQHTWDAGTITTQATATASGIMTYTCTVCSKRKTVDIPATGNATQPNAPTNPASPSEPSTPTDSVVIPSSGTLLVDDDATADYVVTNATTDAPEVSYKFTDKKATSVIIPDVIVVDGVTYKVTSIAANAFKNHKKLKKVTIGVNVISIGKNAFYGCKKLTTVKMGKNVENIGDSAFQNCTALKKIEIPSKVKKIGKKTFYGCKRLTNITIKTTKLTTKNVGKDAFKKAGSSNYKKLTVKVPKKSLKAYKTTLKKRGLNKLAKIKK